MKARAPSFGRPGFATGPPGSAGGASHACGSGGRAADTRGHTAGHGGRHGSIPYAGSADDSEVDPDRPIKCCDDIHSISHYPPLRAMARERVPRTRPRIREILMTGRQRVDRRVRNEDDRTCAAACRCNWRCRLQAGKVKRERERANPSSGVGHGLPERVKGRRSCRRRRPG
ncbi:hypothetical protein DIE08_09205 [Burkholderia sp. Bp9004]|nr:hypothetical protein DIE08_09205 [Burkholderia sp. Bp9004]